MKLSACRWLELGPLTGTWYRAIAQEHWKTRLSTRHTITATGRFSAGSPANPAYQILYLAQDHQLALFEVRALVGKPEDPIPDPRITWTVLPLSVTLEAVVDLTDPIGQKRIGTSDQELTGRWDQYKQSGRAPTQRLGAALFELLRTRRLPRPDVRPGDLGQEPDRLPREAEGAEPGRVPEPEFRQDRAVVALTSPYGCRRAPGRTGHRDNRPGPLLIDQIHALI